jgi:flavin-dependent dehydrogenase
LLQRVPARHAARLALLGDAAGYVDAITGQGLSLAFAASSLLFEALPRDLSGDLAPALRNYDRRVGLKWLRYALPAHALVALSRRPALRRRAIRSAGALHAFGALVDAVG